MHGGFLHRVSARAASVISSTGRHVFSGWSSSAAGTMVISLRFRLGSYECYELNAKAGETFPYELKQFQPMAFPLVHTGLRSNWTHVCAHHLRLSCGWCYFLKFRLCDGYSQKVNTPWALKRAILFSNITPEFLGRFLYFCTSGNMNEYSTKELTKFTTSP